MRLRRWKSTTTTATPGCSSAFSGGSSYPRRQPQAEIHLLRAAWTHRLDMGEETGRSKRRRREIFWATERRGLEDETDARDESQRCGRGRRRAQSGTPWLACREGGAGDGDGNVHSRGQPRHRRRQGPLRSGGGRGRDAQRDAEFELGPGPSDGHARDLSAHASENVADCAEPCMAQRRRNSIESGWRARREDAQERCL